MLDGHTCVVLCAVVSSAALRGPHEEIAFVGSVWAAARVVPTIVLDVEVGAKPVAVLALRALDSLAVVSADADFQAEVLPAGAFGTFALTSFTFTLSFPIPASFRRARVATLPSGVRFPSLSSLETLVKGRCVVERPLVVRQRLGCADRFRKGPRGVVNVVPSPPSPDV